MQTEQEYVNKSWDCPKCGSHNIDIVDPDSFAIEGDMAFVDIGCQDCEFKYYDKYQLIGYGAYDDE